MANNRVAIRAAIQTLLLNATDAEDNVYTNRKNKLWESELPAILISTVQEPALPESLSGRRYIRNLEVKLIIKIASTEASDDDLDVLVGQVETLVNANQFLSGTVLSTIQTNTELIFDAEGETDVAVATLTFECKYIS